ncbi:MAG: 3'-phosphoesterase [Dehalococcoidia bacterium]|nr:MAG: 3'-phosphoesterase [Dehalococcoidia bacterium]
MIQIMLKDYKKKRNFKQTPEPSTSQQSSCKDPLIFVIQKHSARQQHYDLRLEADGVLKSWAIPKEPSLNPKMKRLAVMVEDHPMDYSKFEGIIPEGQYGAGKVIIWDKGNYFPYNNGEYLFTNRSSAQEVIREGLINGKLSIYLEGEKLKGAWTLIRTKPDDKKWLLIKHRDEKTRR